MSWIKNLTLFALIASCFIFGPRVSMEIYRNGLNFENLDKIIELLWSKTFFEILIDAFQIINWIFHWIWQTPEFMLAEFVRNEAKKIPGKEIDFIRNLPIDKHHMFAKATCLTGTNLAEMKNVLDKTYTNVPGNCRDIVLNQAFSDNIIDFRNNDHTKVIDTTTNTAHVFFFFYHTKKLSDENFSTCVLITGVNMTVGQQIAYYDESENGKKFPVFKPTALNQDQLDALFYVMIQNAVENARVILGGTQFLLGSSDNIGKKSEGWKKLSIEKRKTENNKNGMYNQPTNE